MPDAAVRERPYIELASRDFLKAAKDHLNTLYTLKESTDDDAEQEGLEEEITDTEIAIDRVERSLSHVTQE